MYITVITKLLGLKTLMRWRLIWGKLIYVYNLTLLHLLITWYS